MGEGDCHVAFLAPRNDKGGVPDTVPGTGGCKVAGMRQASLRSIMGIPRPPASE
jgi:hypothetical protein